jgi:hypothetical protein
VAQVLFSLCKFADARMSPTLRRQRVCLDLLVIVFVR